ncbi:putative Ubiquitin-like domain-containing protein [Helianthus annuus]|nr:putative Ubiquitin-like domain-containing protein [Helianthus annuus]KAJ0651960.1 putative Ubiquitin-like domain-containing protein [Helianthus annuus]KAJ0692648.1 putative Ubiquitin-like domain-containing protein [Helianthus annuus]KAJ0830645.1 putative Ubiquitin domain-containing protein [Helianthus annuus]KAJ0844031.1 putative Ubiquitin-like domain-containing protein [Helianthus annuus]
MMIIKFKSIKLSRSFLKLRFGKINDNNNNNSKRNRVSLQQCNTTIDAEVKWELRPGGMLVQKREVKEQSMEGVIVVRVVSGSKWHDISIQATSTFGELKMILSMVTSLDPKEQRVLFKGKEREDEEYLHMAGVRDKDKVLMLQDPATKEKKLVTNAMVAAYHTTTV